MASTQGKYNIKAVSNLLGIQPGTLRAWERRYNMIRPNRNDAGHRLYTDEHLNILKWLINKVNRGFTISQAVSLLENNQSHVATAQQEQGKVQSQYLEQLKQEILEALLSFNEKRAHNQLDYAFSIFSPDKVAIDIIGPSLIKIGQLWEENKVTSAHEHFATNFLRSRIGMILISIPTDPMLPKAICVCGPDEKHELGLLIFTLFLKRKGYDVIYLGQSIASHDADTIVEEVEPKYFFMSCTMSENLPESVELAKALQDSFPNLNIGLGGYAYDTLSEEDKQELKPFMVGGSKEEWEQWIENNA